MAMTTGSDEGGVDAAAGIERNTEQAEPGLRPSERIPRPAVSRWPGWGLMVNWGCFAGVASALPTVEEYNSGGTDSSVGGRGGKAGNSIGGDVENTPLRLEAVAMSVDHKFDSKAEGGAEGCPECTRAKAAGAV